MKIKERLIGIASGIILTSIGATIFILFFSDMSVSDGFYVLYLQKKLGALLSIGALLNIPVFFIFINRKLYGRAYGLLGLLFLLVVIIALLKFI